jgi:hypothetical protein
MPYPVFQSRGKQNGAKIATTQTTKQVKKQTNGGGSLPIKTHPHFSLNYRKLKHFPPLDKLATLYDASKQQENIVGDAAVQYNPYKITQCQLYCPIYTQFFKMHSSNYNSIGLNSKFYFDTDGCIICDEPEASAPSLENVHVKSCPLVNPFYYLCGNYGDNVPLENMIPVWNGGTDANGKNAKDEDAKVEDAKVEDANGMNVHSNRIANNSIAMNQYLRRNVNYANNSAFIDAFFVYLSSQGKNRHGMVHGIDFYGTCIGIQELARFDATDDMYYLSESPFFYKSIRMGNVFSSVPIHPPSGNEGGGSRGHKQPLRLTENDDTANDDIITLDVLDFTPFDGGIKEEEIAAHSDVEWNEVEIECDHLTTENNVVTHRNDEDDDDNTNHSDDDEWYDSQGSSICSDSESDEEDDDHSLSSSTNEIEEEPPVHWVYVRNYPVQLTLMEKCTGGTLDELLQSGALANDTQIAAALIQIIMTLIFYQRAFHFTHNDLHTNNILCIPTEIPTLYYRVEGKIYAVPTYGRIFKIIDFGRAIYTFKGKVYASNSFEKGEDAYGQYNTEPFFDASKPRIDPNYSFDLTRLAASMYDFAYSYHHRFHGAAEKDRGKKGAATKEQQHPFAGFCRTVERWCTDDSGKNIVQRKNGDDRSPGFKMYKMIARLCHDHVPIDQLDDDYFAQFVVGKKRWALIQQGKNVMNLDNVHNYAAV